MVEPKRFILETHYSNEFGSGADYFVIEIDKEYALALLKKLELVRRLHQEDDTVYKLHWWDYSGDYYEGDPEEHDAEERQAARMECNQLVISDDIIWKAIPKHTDFYASTTSISVEQLAAIAGVDAALTGGGGTPNAGGNP